MPPPPPTARVEVVRDTYHDVTVEDPYRWMEQESTELDEWLASQASYARAVLDGLPDRAALHRRIRELRGDEPRRHGFACAGERMFWLRHDPGRAVPALVTGDPGGERVLYDPAPAAGGAHTHLDWHVPSPDGRYVACAISTGGGERCTIRIVEVDSGRLLADEVGGGTVRFPFLSWLDDGESFLYHRYPDPLPDAPPAARRLDSRTLWHRLGDDPAGDRTVLARGLNPQLPLAPLDRPFIHHPPGSEWVLAVVSHSALRGDRIDNELFDCTFYVAPVAGLADPAACPWVRIAEPADLVTAFALDRDTSYLVSHRDAPRAEVWAVPLASPSRRRVLVPEGERVLEAVTVVDGCLLVREHDRGISRLRRVDLPGGEPAEVPLPIDGTMLEWSRSPEPATVLLRMESWTAAPSIYRYNVDTDELSDTGWGVNTPAGYGEITAYQVEVPARDGTPVPMTLVHRKALSRDRPRPTLLTAYGSYGIVQSPEFVPGALAWLEQDAVLAYAHVRGGGELGRGWHLAGRMLTKENTVTDVIDCADHLVAQGFTTPGSLAVAGGSAGGIAAGGAMVRRPDLCAAVALYVPLTNALRFELTPGGPVNVPEFGSVATADGLRSLLICDTYERVRDGTAYPAVMLTAGRNDPRVVVWQPAKLAARLQAATTSGRPVLLRIEEHGGHGFGATADQQESELADVFAFLCDLLASR